jgi:formylglycine-generating enzyme required for sulfatase activity/CheY-like chemotaxis protein
MKTLIVDGEPGVAQRLADELASAGWGECLAATTAEDAAEIVNREGGIDLLVVDVFLEDVDGFTLNETMRAALPGLQTIYLTAYDISEQAERIGSDPVLPKPVAAATLAEEMQRLLADDPEPVEEPVLETATAPAEPSVDSLVGTALGNYRLEALFGHDLDGSFYEAVQTSIGRKVELHMLSPERATDPAEVERFLAAARAKANVHHPALLSVFEAGEENGAYFYTSEVRQGSSLAQLAAIYAEVPPAVLLQLLHTVAEVMVHFGQVKTAHEPLHPTHVLLDHRNRGRLVNIATHEATSNTALSDMRVMAEAIMPLVPATPAAESLRQLLLGMRSESIVVRSWTALIYEVKRCAGSGGTKPEYKLDAGGRAAIAAVGAARKRHRFQRSLSIGMVIVAVAACGAGAWFFLHRDVGNRALEKMVEIPGGTILQGSKKVEVAPFWMDVYEVSIGQYADFLRAVQGHPEMIARLVPADMPKDHSFVPKGWQDEQTASGTKPGYFAVAKKGGTYDGATITLDSPVFGVDWYDAYAYATWKRRRLPSEIEWEWAAVGTSGKKFPWGDQAPSGQANLAGDADSFPKWSAVNASPGDQTIQGVAGLAGNVSEWTLTLADAAPGRSVPVVRGGNWAEPKLDIRRRLLDLGPLQSSPTIGFRTVSDTPPTNE